MLNILLWMKKNELNCKTPESKVGDRARITNYKNIFNKGYPKNFSKEIFLIDSVLKCNHGYKISKI